ncbi:glycerol-3-phosphate dehydrogenase/oxidase [Sesbania bispinosa]|nr:glycerol-3-phosphate dehydrogenase/oxidase [Sesbania bispinosa]
MTGLNVPGRARGATATRWWTYGGGGNHDGEVDDCKSGCQERWWLLEFTILYLKIFPELPP